MIERAMPRHPGRSCSRRQHPSRHRQGTRLRRWALPALVLVLAIAVGSCRRHLRPPEPSYKPSRRAAALHPPPSSAKSASPAPDTTRGRKADENGTATKSAPPRPPPPQPLGERSVARASLTPPPPATPKVADPYDPQHPCFSEDQMERAAAVLFEEGQVTDRSRWLMAVNRAVFQLEARCGDDDLLVLVLTTIQLESGVSADPALENRNLERLFQLRLRKIKDEVPLAKSLLESSTLDDAVRKKLRVDTRKGHVRTEGDLVRYVQEDLRPWLIRLLQEEYFLPEAVAAFIAERGVPDPVGTIGPMQVSAGKAFGHAKARGEPVASLAEMRRMLLAEDSAVERGILEGVAQLWPAYAYYRSRLGSEEAVRYATADYNAGEFSSRNAAFQERVGLLSGHTLQLDGDLLVYRDGRPAERASRTESALITLLRNIPAYRIRRDLLMEKAAVFDETRTAREVCEIYTRKTGEACRVARVPAGAGNEAARIKLGRTYTPANYSGAYLRRWKENREIYQGG